MRVSTKMNKKVKYSDIKDGALFREVDGVNPSEICVFMYGSLVYLSSNRIHTLCKPEQLEDQINRGNLIPLSEGEVVTLTQENIWYE